MRPEKIAFVVAVCLVGVGTLLMKVSSEDKGEIPALPERGETGAVVLQKGSSLFDEEVVKRLLMSGGRDPWQRVESVLRPTPQHIPAPEPPSQPPPIAMPSLSSGGSLSFFTSQKLRSIKVVDTPPEAEKEKNDAHK
ncbi:MAG: hypothetical protein DRP63_01165 [Planctomycetota bacterium]|nr:MAG: hypothetical protein DRP63_01165 [Planctomycetota bacterium]